MKFNWYKKIIVLLLALLATNSYSSTELIVSTHTDLISNFIKKADKDASVQITAKFSDGSTPLPGTPFKFSGELDSKSNISSLAVTVYHFAIPETETASITNFIKEELKRSKYESEVSYVKLPPSFKTSQEFESSRLSGILAAVKETGITSPIENLLMILIGVLGFSGLLILFVTNSFSKKVNSGLLKIYENIEQLSMSFGSNNSVEIGQSTAEQQLLSSSKDNNILEDMTTESLFALLRDCYWCEEDQYASYVFKNLRLKNIQALLENYSSLNEYFQFTSNIAAIDNGYANDPYYISPLGIEHLANDDIKDLIESNPEIFGKLPKIRLNHVMIDPKLKLKIASGQIEDKNIDLNLFKNRPSSENRELKMDQFVSISSIEEEKTLIEECNDDTELMQKVPTLHWLTLYKV
jgi:hypothetical protein